MPKVKSIKSANMRFHPFASGFTLPTKGEKLKAVGVLDSTMAEYSTSQDKDGFEFFRTIPQPTCEDDWLAQYKVKGQSFDDYVHKCSWLNKEKIDGIHLQFNSAGRNILEKYPEGKIYLLPIGSFKDRNSMCFGNLAKFASIYLGVPVEILPGIEIDVNYSEEKVFWIKESESDVPVDASSSSCVSLPPRVALESRFHKKGCRYQIGIASLLFMLRQRIPKDALCLIGLTMSDLFREESDLFVAGWAAGGHHVAVFSFFRYNPSIKFSNADWYDIHRNKKTTKIYIQKTVFQRACKLLVHEIGHLLGIAHCIYFECCMNGSGHLVEDFRQPLHLCPVDLHKLQVLVGFDVVKRYEALREFYEENGMKKEADWVQRRIQFIEQSKQKEKY